MEETVEETTEETASEPTQVQMVQAKINWFANIGSLVQKAHDNFVEGIVKERDEFLSEAGVLEGYKEFEARMKARTESDMEIVKPINASIRILGEWGRSLIEGTEPPSQEALEKVEVFAQQVSEMLQGSVAKNQEQSEEIEETEESSEKVEVEE